MSVCTGGVEGRVRHREEKGVRLSNFTTRGARKFWREGKGSARRAVQESAGKMLRKGVVVALCPEISLVGVDVAENRDEEGNDSRAGLKESRRRDDTVMSKL